MRGDVLVALAGHHDDRKGQASLHPQRLQQVERRVAGKAVVEQQDVERRVVAGRCREAAQDLGGRGHHLALEMGRVFGEMAQRQVDVGGMMLGVEHPERALTPGVLAAEARKCGVERGPYFLWEVLTLGLVVVGAGLEGGDRRRLVSLACEQHTGQRKPALTHLAHQIEAAAVGEVQVGQHEVVAVGVFQAPVRLSQRRGDVHRVPAVLTPQRARDEVGIGRVVFEVEDPHERVSAGCRLR